MNWIKEVYYFKEKILSYLISLLLGIFMGLLLIKQNWILFEQPEPTLLFAILFVLGFFADISLLKKTGPASYLMSALMFLLPVGLAYV